MAPTLNKIVGLDLVDTPTVHVHVNAEAKERLELLRELFRSVRNNSGVHVIRLFEEHNAGASARLVDGGTAPAIFRMQRVADHPHFDANPQLMFQENEDAIPTLLLEQSGETTRVVPLTVPAGTSVEAAMREANITVDPATHDLVIRAFTKRNDDEWEAETHAQDLITYGHVYEIRAVLKPPVEAPVEAPVEVPAAVEAPAVVEEPRVEEEHPLEAADEQEDSELDSTQYETDEDEEEDEGEEEHTSQCEYLNGAPDSSDSSDSDWSDATVNSSEETSSGSSEEESGSDEEEEEVERVQVAVEEPQRVAALPEDVPHVAAAAEVPQAPPRAAHCRCREEHEEMNELIEDVISNVASVGQQVERVTEDVKTLKEQMEGFERRMDGLDAGTAARPAAPQAEATAPQTEEPAVVPNQEVACPLAPLFGFPFDVLQVISENEWTRAASTAIARALHGLNEFGAELFSG
ncbi:hypothetical protein M3Y99_00430100 [Aphelenchoides fujianensis]|nr:hypothetical protein M3Y99_00430100 [Aphelenchoides fujianensis]